MSAYSTIALYLWKEYGFDLPDTPNNLAKHILLALEKDGFVIESKKDGPPHKG